MTKPSEKRGAADAPLELNAAQRKAVEHGGAPLLVVAGAGKVSVNFPKQFRWTLRRKAVRMPPSNSPQQFPRRQ